MKLTERSVSALRARDTDYFIWDERLKGFGVRVHPTGRVVFYLQYRVRGARRSQRLVLDRKSDQTVDDLRAIAESHRATARNGIDPALAMRSNSERPTVKDVSERYLANVLNYQKPRSAREYARLYKRHILPALGRKPVADVRVEDIERLHRNLKDKPVLANRVLARLKTFFVFCRREKLTVGDNPAHGLTMYRESSRERFLSEKEFATLGAALAKAEQHGLLPAPKKRKKPKDEKNVKVKHRAKKTWGKPIPASPIAVNAIRLMSLTAMRKSEVLSLRWSDIDVERGYIVLSDSKTGKSARPLAAPASLLLTNIPRLGGPFVFPGTKPGTHLATLARIWDAVRNEAKMPTLRLHDLRHSVASVLAANGESLLIIAAILGQADVSSARRYSHLSDDPVKAAIDRAAGNISAWMGVNETPVTPMKSKQKKRA